MRAVTIRVRMNSRAVADLADWVKLRGGEIDGTGIVTGRYGWANIEDDHEDLMVACESSGWNQMDNEGKRATLEAAVDDAGWMAGGNPGELLSKTVRDLAQEA